MRVEQIIGDLENLGWYLPFVSVNSWERGGLFVILLDMGHSVTNIPLCTGSYAGVGGWNDPGEHVGWQRVFYLLLHLLRTSSLQQTCSR